MIEVLSEKAKAKVKQYLRSAYGIEAGDILQVYEAEWDCEMCDDTCGYFEFGSCIEYTDTNHMKRELREPNFYMPEFLREYTTKNNG